MACPTHKSYKEKLGEVGYAGTKGSTRRWRWRCWWRGRRRGRGRGRLTFSSLPPATASFSIPTPFLCTSFSSSSFPSPPAAMPLSALWSPVLLSATRSLCAWISAWVSWCCLISLASSSIFLVILPRMRPSLALSHFSCLVSETIARVLGSAFSWWKCGRQEMHRVF